MLKMLLLNDDRCKNAMVATSKGCKIKCLKGVICLSLKVLVFVFVFVFVLSTGKRQQATV